MNRVESILAELNIPEEEIVIRMTGCPNGCARPYMAEIAFVGRGPGKYQLYLGGNVQCTRLNQLWKENVKDADIVPELRTILKRFVETRQSGERFGDWVVRAWFIEHPPVPQFTADKI